MLHAVARQERDTPPADLAEDDRRRRLPEGGLDVDRLGGLEEGIEAGSAEDADLGRGQDALSPLEAFEPLEAFDPLEVVEPLEPPVDAAAVEGDDSDEPESDEPEDVDAPSFPPSFVPSFPLSFPPSPSEDDLGFDRLSVA